MYWIVSSALRYTSARAIITVDLRAASGAVNLADVVELVNPRGHAPRREESGARAFKLAARGDSKVISDCGTLF